MRKQLCLILWLLAAGFSPGASADELRVEVIEPRHRLAEELLPALEPLVGARGSITVFQGKLVVKASPSDLDELRGALAQLDKPSRQLLVLVTQNADLVRKDQGIAAEGEIEAGDVGAEFSPDLSALHEFAIGEDEARIRAQSERSETRRSDVQRVRVLDGHDAVVYVGQSVPVVSRAVSYDGLPYEAVEYRDVRVGFVVRPQVTGKRVTLRIHPQQDVLSERPGVVNVQHIGTTVSGRLGEWVSIGAIAQRQSGRNRGLTSGRQSEESEQREVWLQVQEVQD